MAEENTTDTAETTEEKTLLEENFRLFGIFRMQWKDIKSLSDEDRSFLLDKADKVEEQAKRQAEAQRQMYEQQMQQGTGGSGLVTPEGQQLQLD